LPGSLLFYVQHLLGIGHLQRALRIAEALTREGIRVTLVCGGAPIETLAGASADRIVQLPPVKARDARFRELVDAVGRPVDDVLRNARRAALLAAFAAARPDAVLLEAFPFGRRAFRFELDPLLDAARARHPRPLILCSLRDIVVAPDHEPRRREIVDRVRRDFDFVLVHGDPAFIPLEASFPVTSEIADRLIYTGYIGEDEEHIGPAPAAGSAELAGKDEVLVSVGGGAVGGVLLSTALEARRRGTLAGHKWRVLAGPNLPADEFARLAAGLPQGVILERFRRDFRQMLRRCRVSISQAGYNTVLDILAARAAAVVVPFAAHRETEQSLRAERLAANGVLELVHERELSPGRLAGAIDRAIACRCRPPVPLATTGARVTAALIAEMVRSPGNLKGVPLRTLYRRAVPL
jgi:predicted glycosyltransferase